jgi:hypothetical protein
MSYLILIVVFVVQLDHLVQDEFDDPARLVLC